MAYRKYSTLLRGQDVKLEYAFWKLINHKIRKVCFNNLLDCKTVIFYLVLKMAKCQNQLKRIKMFMGQLNPLNMQLYFECKFPLLLSFFCLYIFWFDNVNRVHQMYIRVRSEYIHVWYSNGVQDESTLWFFDLYCILYCNLSCWPNTYI